MLLAAKDSAAFPSRLRSSVSRLLLELGVPANIVRDEVAAMEQFAIAPTANRSILGCMRDAQFALEYAIESGKYPTLDQLEMYLTRHIHGPTGHRPPGELAVELLLTAAHA